MSSIYGEFIFCKTDAPRACCSSGVVLSCALAFVRVNGSIVSEVVWKSADSMLAWSVNSTSLEKSLEFAMSEF